MKLDYDDHWFFGRVIVISLLIVATGYNAVQFVKFVLIDDPTVWLQVFLDDSYDSLFQFLIILSALVILPEFRSRLVAILCLGFAVSFVEAVGLHISFDSTKHAYASANSMLFYASLAFTFLVMTYGFIRLIRKTGGPARVYFILGIMFSLVFCGRLQVLLYWKQRLLRWGNDTLILSFLFLVCALGIGLMMTFLAYLLLKNEVPRDRDAKVSSDEL